MNCNSCTRNQGCLLTISSKQQESQSPMIQHVLYHNCNDMVIYDTYYSIRLSVGFQNAMKRISSKNHRKNIDDKKEAN